MLIFLNGRFVPENEAMVSVFDRGFLYGDGLFETMRVVNGQPFRWAQHLDRLQRGAEFLRIKLPYSTEQLIDFAARLIARNQLPEAILRLTVSRGVGGRGYSPRDAGQPTCVMTLHPVPAATSGKGWKLITSTLRLPTNDPLARFKTANKLWQVTARSEADTAGADEALLLNTDGYVAEATSANVFWVEGDTICTPPLTAGILPGVTRAGVMELCGTRGLVVRKKMITPQKLIRASGVFLTLGSLGVVSVTELDGRKLPSSPLIEVLRSDYAKMAGV